MNDESEFEIGLEGIANLKYPLFYKKNVTRQWARLARPVISRTENYVLPRASAIHFIPESNHEYGIDMSHSLMRHIGDRALIYHIEKMDIILGHARHLSISPETMIKTYHRRYRNLIRVRNIDKSNINDHLHMVVNYSILPHMYVQAHNSLQVYQEWYNLRQCMWKTINELGDFRFHFIPFRVPKFLPGKNEFKLFSEKMSVTGLKHFHTNETFDLLELWKIVHDVSIGGNSPVSESIAKKTNLVFIESGQLSTLNLNDLLTWAKDEPATIMNKFYVFMDQLLSMRSMTVTSEVLKAIVATDETAMPDTEVSFELTSDEKLLAKEKTEHEMEVELVQQAQVASDLVDEMEVDVEEVVLAATPVQERIMERAAAGTLSGVEQRGLMKLSERWKNIPNPFNKNEKLGDMRITEEDLMIVDKPIVRDVISIPDKSLLHSKVQDFDKQYIEKVMHKDLLNVCLSIQNGGVIVKDIHVTEKNTAVTKTQTFHIQLQPIGGQASTVKFTVPKMEKDGTFLCNGVVYRHDKQKSDLPIFKTKPYTVALTSYYGKSFIVRNQNVATNYGRWLKNKIVKASVDSEDNTITDVTHGINKFNGIKLPRPYTAVAEELNAFSTPNYQFFWNYKKLNTFFSDEEIKICKKHDLIPCARSLMTDSIILGMDPAGAVFEVKGNETSLISSLPALLNSDWGEGPMEYAELGIFNRRIPIILALIYKKGLEKTFTDLGIQYSRIPPTARYAATQNTYRLKFKDESFVIDIRKPEIRLLIAGFNAVRKNISDYNSHELNKRSSFSYLLSGSGITQQHLRELLLMYDMFIDPITKELLIDMKEPTTFEGLLLRANEMLIDDWVSDNEQTRFKGYERFAGMAYTQIVQSMRGYRSKGNVSGAEVTMNPSSVFFDIIQDQSITLIEDSNPIHNLKEKEAVTFSGAGGRSSVTMVKETRGFQKGDLGVISEATPDSGKVGIRTYMSANPNLVNLRGISREFNEKTDGASSLISTSALLAPAANHDD